MITLVSDSSPFGPGIGTRQNHPAASRQSRPDGRYRPETNQIILIKE
jgi:hypothetical protein